MKIPYGRFRPMQTASFQSNMEDTVQRLTYDEDGGGTDNYGNALPGWTAATSLDCSFVPRVTREVLGETEVSEIDADCYLPLDTTITGTDRVKHTHNHGVALATQYSYEVVGVPLIEDTSIHLELKRVTDG